MKFVEKQFYHVFNQGNNHRKVFYSEADYELYLFKLKSYLTPFADIIAFCLMPNHYHHLLYVKNTTIPRKRLVNEIEKIQNQYLEERNIKRRIRPVRIDLNKPSAISLEQAIGIIQRSYTRSINPKKGWSGSVFRNNFKIKEDWKNEFVGVNDERFTNNLFYVGKCIDYIHQNPVRANLCTEALEWKYSSAKEHLGLKGFGICNLEILKS